MFRTFILIAVQFVFAHSGSMKLDNSNFDKIIGNHDIVFINFYADWCRFSQLLAPTWDEIADKVALLHPGPGKVVIGKVDCDAEGDIAKRFHISKYPTLKLLLNGQVSKREYRGQRSVEAITEFVGQQLKDPVTIIKQLDEINKLEENKNKRIIIGYFDSEASSDYQNLQKVAKTLKEDCNFYAGFGDTVKVMRPPGTNILNFKAKITDEDELFSGRMSSHDELSIWATERCVPLVREITFQNAEEFTEEGLPFLILFHMPEDTDSIKRYTKVIQNELLDQKQSINFLTADGLTFAHPLHHLGKSKEDLPIIALDSFRHMYLFPNFSEMEVKGKLKQFLLDLHSGKLHREFHYGPDPTTNENQIEDHSGGVKSPSKKVTTPPKSTFQKLAPSKNRYTLLDDKDEL